MIRIISIISILVTSICFSQENRLFYDGREWNDIRKKSISIIFQNINLLNDFTAIENILMPLYIKGTDHITATIKAKNIYIIRLVRKQIIYTKHIQTVII